MLELKRLGFMQFDDFVTGKTPQNDNFENQKLKWNITKKIVLFFTMDNS